MGRRQVVRVRELRAHHVKEWLFFEYMRHKYIAKSVVSDEKLYLFEYPILVTSAIDDMCRKCLDYPAINFCRGIALKNLDVLDAQILGIEIGQEYSFRRLAEILKATAKGMRIEAGKEDYDWRVLAKEFYRGRKDLPSFIVKEKKWPRV